MDEYLDEEVDFINSSFDTICRAWEKQVCFALKTLMMNLD